ncbi:CARDB domain-containing protein [aff. Roholtiella sp. LEGE 12411]|uniref:CARDB domain-containing protein n=1 Tax=aff. Roholtiella sp. LEGE 12411 TaxID=1828822 RepID=UPI00188017BF|nr:CARDB domain-containing protein [aff. Roholtiella sp. LEGE 12411]MBE9038460.1 hypothetical protein [aff. Roholtiella sp. LEGE 12411]
MVKPDLIVSSVTAPLLGYVSNNIYVSWTVINQGEEITTANWYDSIYLSDDEFLDDSDLFVTSVSSENNTPLAAGDSYTTTQSTYIPYDATAGSRYLLFATDRNNDQSETNEDNNVFAQPINLTVSGVVISNVTAPSSAVLGETIRVSWTVTNQGNAIASSNFDDGIYISYQPYLSGIARDDEFYQVGSRSSEGDTPLAPGASYTAYADIYLLSNKESSNGLANTFNFVGDRYLGVYVGGYSYYNRIGSEGFQAIPIQLNAPNLVVSDAEVLTPAITGETVDVSWTVTNQGEFYAPTDWYDAVYFSTDDVLDLYDDILDKYQYDSKLIEVPIGEQTPLAAGASYTLNQTITIPNSIGGSGYLLFMVDANITDFESERTGIQGETDETDNIRAVPINFAGPDFIVESATAPISAAFGETISVSWTVKNQGNSPALAYYWSDVVYLSTDDVLDDNDVSVKYASVENNTSLAAGASYTVTEDITLPNSLSSNSNYYLLFAANRNNNQGETDKTNNVLAKPISLAILSAGVTIAETDGSTNVTEGGATDTYTVALTSQPTADVAIAINPISQITADVNTLTFTATNWNQAQTITVAAVDDDVVEGNHTSTLTLTATSADASYNNIAINSINVSITDNDQLINGTSGRDTLVGSNGTDIITGFKGKDILTGGAGSDQFVYTSIRDAGDEITDFVAGTDKIVLLTLFQSLSLDNLNYESATTQGHLSFGTKGSNTTVLIDPDGLGGRGRSTTLLTVQGLDQATLANADNFLF